MSDTIDLCGRPFHFIGVGGIGMSALAYILAQRQLPVSGSDIRKTHITQRLEAIGTRVFTQQAADNLAMYRTSVSASQSRGGLSTLTAPLVSEVAIAQSPQIICSTAIHPDNAEYRAALEYGYPIFHRSDVLAALIREYESVAVAGTHGKTTTSSLISYVLLQAGLDPTVIVGGEVEAIGGNARLGQSPYLVAEADESDGSLTKLCPAYGIVTNIELDHPDHYQDVSEVVAVFQTFERQCQTLIACWDCALIRQHLQPQLTYSLEPERGADYTVSQVRYHAEGTTAMVIERGVPLGSLELKLLGQHNLSNALAAIAVARQLGLSFGVIADAIAAFEGAKRRFEVRGQVQNITFIDDYAHHPSELQATLTAARLRVDAPNGQIGHRLVAIFQPHRYSRTRTFLAEFAQAFQAADVVVVTDIYGAGEANPTGISGQILADAIAQYHSHVIYQDSLTKIQEFLRKFLQSGDFALFLGAGNLNQQIPPLIEYFTHPQA